MVGEIPEGCLYIAVKGDPTGLIFRDSQGKYELLSVGADKEALYKRDPSSSRFIDDAYYLEHKDGVWLIYQCTNNFHSRPIQNDYYRISSKGQYCKGEFKNILYNVGCVFPMVISSEFHMGQ